MHYFDEKKNVKSPSVRGSTPDILLPALGTKTSSLETLRALQKRTQKKWPPLSFSEDAHV